MSDNERPTFTDLGKVLVIIPTYNESENIENIVGRLRKAVPEVDVLVADDNSPDGTGAIADTLAEADPQVWVMHRAGKEGLGAAYLAGFHWGLDRGYQFLVEMDADGSHQPEQLPRLLEAARDADLVLGSRWVPGGSVVNWPAYRKAISRGGSTYSRLMLGMDARDITGGFRVFRRETLLGIGMDDVASQGYCFQVDLAWRAVRRGFRVVEVPITFVERERGNSKMSRTILAEALWRVTAWGVGRRTGRDFDAQTAVTSDGDDPQAGPEAGASTPRQPGDRAGQDTDDTQAGDDASAPPVRSVDTTTSEPPADEGSDRQPEAAAEAVSDPGHTAAPEAGQTGGADTEPPVRTEDISGASARPTAPSPADAPQADEHGTDDEPADPTKPRSGSADTPRTPDGAGEPATDSAGKAGGRKPAKRARAPRSTTAAKSAASGKPARAGKAAKTVETSRTAGSDKPAKPSKSARSPESSAVKPPPAARRSATSTKPQSGRTEAEKIQGKAAGPSGVAADEGAARPA